MDDIGVMMWRLARRMIVPGAETEGAADDRSGAPKRPAVLHPPAAE